MPLKNTIDIPFSELKDNHEEALVWFRRSGREKAIKFERYGILPNGDSFGVVGVDVDFDPGYWEQDAVVAGPDGECKDLTLLKEHYFHRFPDAMAASPTGKRIFWKIGGKIYRWDCLGLYLHKVCINYYLPEKTEITDAVMRENGLLDIFCSDRITRRYICDVDALLVFMNGEWVAYCGEDSCDGHNYSLQEIMYEEPHVYSLVVREDVENIGPMVFSGCGLRGIRLPQSLESIEYQAFADNTGLKKIIIPAGVLEVDSGAFLGCSALQDLVIEGDTARTSLWAEDAFLGCPCEKTYLQIRADARKNDN